MNKPQQFGLLAREHRRFPLASPCGPQVPLRKRRAAETKHERTLSVPYVFCNHLI